MIQAHRMWRQLLAKCFDCKALWRKTEQDNKVHRVDGVIRCCFKEPFMSCDHCWGLFSYLFKYKQDLLLWQSLFRTVNVSLFHKTASLFASSTTDLLKTNLCLYSPEYFFFPIKSNCKCSSCLSCLCTVEWNKTGLPVLYPKLYCIVNIHNCLCAMLTSVSAYPLSSVAFWNL